MVVLDEDFGTNLTLVEGNGGVRLSPVSVPEHAPRDWRSQCERERARADAAEARAEELRWAEVAARSDGGSWKSRFKACRRRLSEAVEETKEARRTARDVPSLQAEVARLETLLSEAGIASAFDTAGALRKENARLRKALAASKAREGATGPWPAPPQRRTVLEPSPDQKETVRSLRTELRRLDKEVVRRDKENARLNTRLDQEKERTERIRGTARKLSSESLRLHREVRILGDSEARARSLSDEVFWLRHALEVSRAGKEKLKARLAKLRAAGAMLSKLPSDEAAQAAALLADLDALRDLPAAPFEACEHMPGQVSSTALVRYRLVDYSAPAVHAHKKVTVKGYVERVEIALGAEIVARHRRSYVRGDVVYDPLHYLSLLEKKPGALDQAAPLRGWKLDPAFDTLRRLLEARFGPRGKREYIQVLRLHEDFPEPQVAAAVRDAVKRRLIGFDAVKHLLLARIERRPVHLDLSRYPHLPQPFVAATRSADYATLLAGGAGHG